MTQAAIGPQADTPAETPYSLIMWAKRHARQVATKSGEVDVHADRVLICLAGYANNDSRKAWPSIATMARETGMCDETIRRKLRVLEKAGVITQAGATDSGVTVWRLQLEAVRGEARPNELARVTRRQKDAVRAKAYRAKQREKLARLGGLTGPENGQSDADLQEQAQERHAPAVRDVTHSDTVTEVSVTDSQSVRHALGHRDVTDSRMGKLLVGTTTELPVEEMNSQPSGGSAGADSAETQPASGQSPALPDHDEPAAETPSVATQASRPGGEQGSGSGSSVPVAEAVATARATQAVAPSELRAATLEAAVADGDWDEAGRRAHDVLRLRRVSPVQLDNWQAPQLAGAYRQASGGNGRAKADLVRLKLHVPASWLESA